MAMAFGHGHRPWPKAMALGHGLGPWPEAMALRIEIFVSQEFIVLGMNQVEN